jgi:hypothetical protein
VLVDVDEEHPEQGNHPRGHAEDVCSDDALGRHDPGPRFRRSEISAGASDDGARSVALQAGAGQPAAPVSETEVRQTVEIGLVNINTQAARSVVDNQIWRYDEVQKRWWLTTGLPDITRHN